MNRLAKETSPYLLQHKHNPVDWYPWGKEALAAAKKQNKPIFLSIGYSACHWCHVMEKESFENEAIAKLLNKYFINIKVDREERPDLDDIYMAFVQSLTGRGGWPMSVWLTPDLQPFYGGTYFPPEDKMNLPGFPRVVEGLAKAWREKEKEIRADAGKIVAHLKKRLTPEIAPGEIEVAHLDAFAPQSAERYDAEYGGFGDARTGFQPKFPHASELSMLLRHHARTGDAQSLEIVENTLTRMANGGIYDHLAGGFHRYATDRTWLVPHFEKMLYDNSLLTRTYLEAYQATGKEIHARVARETLDYLLREMQDQAGGFYSTTDADSEGVEGKFFIWTKKELDDLLGADSEVACRHFGVTDEGNWHEMPGHTVLSVVADIPAVAKMLKLPEKEVGERLARAKKKLLAQRGKRVPPGTDDKVLAAWNGMAIAALSTGYKVLGDERYLQAAQRAASFLLTEMTDANGRLYRTWRRLDGDGGRAHLAAYLDDYGFCADALLQLFECDFDPRWLEAAGKMVAVMAERFLDKEDGNFFFTADDHEKLVARNKSVMDSSIPSGTAMAVVSFLRIGLLTGDSDVVEMAQRALRANHAYISRFGTACPSLLLVADLMLSDPKEVVLAGEPKDPRIQGFLQKLRGTFPEHHVVALLHAGNRDRLLKLSKVFAGKDLVDGKPAAYVCTLGVCKAPVTDPEQLVLRQKKR
ncbi:MAG: thioredoxin domain-containing protein [Planctomycetota bacterium]